MRLVYLKNFGECGLKRNERSLSGQLFSQKLCVLS